jgi:hypothetical protein
MAKKPCKPKRQRIGNNILIYNKKQNALVLNMRGNQSTIFGRAFKKVYR